jgi:hypothetical protein
MFPCASGGVVALTEAPSRMVEVAAAGLAARLGVPLLEDGGDAATRSGPDLLLVTDDVPLDAEAAWAEDGMVGQLLAGSTPAELATAIAAYTHDVRVVLLPNEVPLEVGLQVVARHGGLLLPELTEPELVALHDAGFKVVTTGAPRSLDVTPFPIPVVSVEDPGRLDPRLDLWLVGALPTAPMLWLDVASALGREQRVAAAPSDPREDTALQEVLAELGDDLGIIRRDAAATDWEDWQLETVLGGTELPGGGYTLFPSRSSVASVSSASRARRRQSSARARSLRSTTAATCRWCRPSTSSPRWPRAAPPRTATTAPRLTRRSCGPGSRRRLRPAST